MQMQDWRSLYLQRLGNKVLKNTLNLGQALECIASVLQAVLLGSPVQNLHCICLQHSSARIA